MEQLGALLGGGVRLGKGIGGSDTKCGIGGGNRGLVKADASVSGRTGIVDYALSVAAEGSNGFNARPAPATPTFTPNS